MEATARPWKYAGRAVPVKDENGAVDDLWCGSIDAVDGKYRGQIASIQSADHIKGISIEEAEANAALIVHAVNNIARITAERDGLRKALKCLNEVAPAVENLACHQKQLDRDGVMVGVSRQALDEILSAVDTVVSMATVAVSDADGGGQ